MTYISNEEIATLPEDSEEAFVELEHIVRERYERAHMALHENESSLPILKRYMSIVLPAAKHYCIAGLSDWGKPKSTEDNWAYFEAFIAEVDYCITDLRLRSNGRAKQHSVALDTAAKTKLRHLLAQAREMVDKLDISVAKKERLYSRINALQVEIDRERTRYQAFAALMIEASDDIGEAAKHLEPLVQRIERIGAAIGIAKRAEESAPKLPPRKESKQIEAPKKSGNNSDKAPNFDTPLDDEIPF